MPHVIGKVDDRYFVFSTVVDAPITRLMTKAEFEEYYRKEYGTVGLKELVPRLERTDAKGTSSHLYDSFEEMVCCNRYGDGEETLTRDEFISQLKRETEEIIASELEDA